MRTISKFLILALFPLATFANDSIVIIGEGAPSATAAKTAPSAAPVPGKEFPNFPENAITRIGENTTGQHVDVPATPATPAAPTPPAASAAPANPPAPVNPKSPVSKLWPRDTVAIFMPSCMGFHPKEFFLPCQCTITKLMAAMPHDEFLKKSEDGTIESDPRLMDIRRDCATAPKKKDE